MLGGMRRLAVPLLILLLLCALPAMAQPRLSGWKPQVDWIFYGNILTPPDVFQRADRNTKAEAYLRPTVRLVEWTGRTRLVGYAIVGVLKDRNRFSYNNKATLTLGMEVSHKVRAVRLRFGGRWSVEQEFSTGTRNSAFQLTADADWWKTWAPGWLTRRLPDGSRLVLSGWANFRYPAALDPFEKDNGLLQGSVKLAVDVPWRETRLSLSPFVSVKAKWDIRKRPYNNFVEPALGLDLKWALKENGQVTLGVKSARQIRTTTDTRQGGVIGYVSWYKRF